MKIVCLVGSRRFRSAFDEVARQETLNGNIVLSLGVWDEVGSTDRQRLDQLHRAKIDMADVVFVINVDGYIGESTRAEVRYALDNYKAVYWLEPYAVKNSQLDDEYRINDHLARLAASDSFGDVGGAARDGLNLARLIRIKLNKAEVAMRYEKDVVEHLRSEVARLKRLSRTP